MHSDVFFRSVAPIIRRNMLFVIIITFSAAGVSVFAQHDHRAQPDRINQPKPQQPAAQDADAQPMPADHAEHAPANTDATPADQAPGVEDASQTQKHDHGAHMSNGSGLMQMSGDQMSVRVGGAARNFMSLNQVGSGTALQPASTPMYMWHKMAGDWLLMFHGDVKFGVNSQRGPRGVTKVESSNWLMPMAYRRVGAGTLQLRGMFSGEAFSFPPGGSPQLFQTGETYQGQPLIDRQHPHDLFMELSAQYTVPLGERGTWFSYVALPGEPALGPVAFMHRNSASQNPSPVLSHHLQDSTHISFGVLTSGFTYRGLKVEGSLFNGREPDEERYDLEFNKWNSRAVRLTYAPNSDWTMQWSYGLLKNPEALEPGDVRRMTASIMHNKTWARGSWATTFVWGRNREEHDGVAKLNGYTAESTLNFIDRNYLYTRLELVDKNSLLTDADRAALNIEDHHPQFRIGAYTFGAARDVWQTDNLAVALGGDFTFYSKPEILDAIYGRRPTAYKFYLRFRPNRMRRH